METPWEHRYSLRAKKMKGSAIRELLKMTARPDIISFGGGLLAPDIFPVEELRAASNRIFDDPKLTRIALQYGTTEGYLPLRELIAEMSSTDGVCVSPANIMITTGSQQALDLLGKVFINEGDHILTESPTYLGALQAWNAYGSQYITVSSDEDGMVTEDLDAALRLGPKFMYVLPNFQNPTGVTLSMERRHKIIELAQKYGVPIVEDDPYGQLRFEGEFMPSLMALDAQSHPDAGCNSSNVIFLSTFSKILTPGLRLAWVIAPEQVILKMAQAKQGMDLHTSTFNQVLSHEVAKGPFLNQHIARICEVYKHRRNVMLDSLAEHMPAGVKWTEPKGGLFLWVTLPEGFVASEVFKHAVEEKVAFVPGDSFHPNGGGTNTMRLNFSCEKPEVINEGIARLGKVMRKLM